MYKKIRQFYALDPTGWRYFAVTSMIYLFLKYLPCLLKAFFLYRVTEIIKLLYGVLNELCAALVTGVFFSVTVGVLNKKEQIRNKLNFAIYVYQSMKKEVLAVLLSDEMLFVPYEQCDIQIQLLSSNPAQARKYFSHQRFSNVLEHLQNNDQLSRNIMRKIQRCIEDLAVLKYGFIEEGDFTMKFIIDCLRDLEEEVEDSTYVFRLDWTEDIQPKSLSKIYLLFCQEINGKDPLLQKLEDLLRPYA